MQVKNLNLKTKILMDKLIYLQKNEAGYREMLEEVENKGIQNLMLSAPEKETVYFEDFIEEIGHKEEIINVLTYALQEKLETYQNQLEDIHQALEQVEITF